MSSSAADLVSKIWDTIEQPVATPCFEEQPDDAAGWKVVRLFVSSTFRDFHSEREVLVKQVIPELREFCERRCLHLVECDLRWGVPKDSTTRETICTCLEELDRCLHDQEGEPFFLCMLAERFGWVPTLAELPSDIIDRYSWVDGVSITTMEILHGAYRCKNRNAAFFLRDGHVIDDVPSEERAAFIEDDPLYCLHRKTLKGKLREKFTEKVFDYSCQLVTDGNRDVSFKYLDDFASKALEFFKRKIEEKYPNRENKTEHSEKATIESNLQSSFITQKSRLLIGRERELSDLSEYAKTGHVTGLTSYADNSDDADEKWLQENLKKMTNLNTDAIRGLCVTSRPGFGKTALLATFVKLMSEEKYEVFYHFASGSKESSKRLDFVTRLLLWLKRRADNESIQEKDLPIDDVDGMVQLVYEQFNKLSELTANRYLFVIDGVDEMDESQSTSYMDWLPARFADNMTVVISCTSNHMPSLARVQSRGMIMLQLPELTLDSRRTMAEKFFANINKRLDPEQLQLLVSHEGAGCPLWLHSACEELRVFGTFEKVTQVIRQFPDSLEGLMGAVLARMSGDDETGNVAKFWCLLYCSSSGLGEEDIVSLLGAAEGVPLASLPWGTIRRTVKSLLSSTNNRGERLTFIHNAVREAVESTFLQNTADRVAFHSKIADYCEQTIEKFADYKTRELCYQLKQANQTQRLVRFLRVNQMSRFVSDFERRDYLKAYRCQKRVLALPNQTKPEALLCMACSIKSGIFSWHPGPAHDKCSICGIWSPHNFAHATLCVQHFKRSGSAKQMFCFACGAFTTTLNAKNVRVCYHCSAGPYRDVCCKFTVV